MRKFYYYCMGAHCSYHQWQHNSSFRRLFSPDDHPTKKLISLIDGAKRTIHAAVYMLTDKTIAESADTSKNDRNIDVQIITDKITVTSSFGKGHFLREKWRQSLVL